MSHETPDIEFRDHGPVDENLAYTHAAILNGALDKMATLGDAMPGRLTRPFRRDSVEDIGLSIRNTAKKAGRKFEEIQEVVEANRRQGQVLTYLFDYSEASSYDPGVVGQALGDLYDIRGVLASENIARVIKDVYNRDQIDRPQLTTFHVFDSLSPVLQPPGKAVRRALEYLGFDKPIATDPLFQANKEWDEAGNLKTHATITPKFEMPDGHTDQGHRSITAHYSQDGPDVAVSVIVAVQALKGQDG